MNPNPTDITPANPTPGIVTPTDPTPSVTTPTDDSKPATTNTDNGSKKEKSEPLKSGSKISAGKKGAKIYYTVRGNLKLEVTSVDDITSVVIPATVKYKNFTYKVEYIGKSAFAGMNKLKKVIIGSNIKKISKNAFNNCSKLKTITFSGKNKSISIGKNAFKDINKKATFNIKKRVFTAYRKKIKSSGVSKTVKFTKK